jgi:hypothetical protein
MKVDRNSKGGVMERKAVRFTADNLGVLDNIYAQRFSNYHASKGDEGILVGPHPHPDLEKQGWLIVEIEQGVVPVTPDMIEEIPE